MKNKAYRASPVGEAVGRYLNEMQYAGLRPNSIESYEQPLAWLAVAHDDLSGVDAFCKAGGTEMLMEFLHGNWGSAAETTRAHRWTVLNVFFGWCLDKNMIPFNPMRGIRRPRKRPAAERNAYGPDVIHQLTVAQGTLRDQCAIQLLGRMALRKDELRLLRIGDIDLVRNLVTVHGKGGKVAVLPIGFESLRADLYLYIQGEQRHHDEYLLYPKGNRLQPMDPSSVHRWFKACLERAGLPATVKLHEMRHSAADNMHRMNGIMAAKELLRHENVATTQIYLHPTRDDLAAAMLRVDRAWQAE